MDANSPIRLGSRVYLRNCVAGDPGCVIGFSKQGKACVEWYDLDIGRPTEHDLASLILDESFRVEQLGFCFDNQAA
jgi:hypothetical protein